MLLVAFHVNTKFYALLCFLNALFNFTVKPCFMQTVMIKSLSTVQSPPRIIKQPPTDELLFQVAQQQNENDKPFIIECEAEGEPAPKYVFLT
jgi:hypothetical protein